MSKNMDTEYEVWINIKNNEVKMSIARYAELIEKENRLIEIQINEKHIEQAKIDMQIKELRLENFGKLKYQLSLDLMTNNLNKFETQFELTEYERELLKLYNSFISMN